jgi:transketolase N-terminal domain/subunit
MEWLTRFTTLVTTNAIKLGGLYVGIKAGTRVPAELAVMGWSAFAMAGAQISETLVLAALDKFFGGKK